MEPPGDSRRAVFRVLMDAVWAQAEGSLIEPRRKKSPVFGSRLAFRNVGQRWFIRFHLMRSEPLVPVSCRVTWTTPVGP